MKHRKRLEQKLKAVANSRRLQILSMLRKRNADVTTIAKALGISIESTSSHLLKLYNADNVERAKRGNRVFYRISLRQEQPIKSVLVHL